MKYHNSLPVTLLREQQHVAFLQTPDDKIRSTRLLIIHRQNCEQTHMNMNTISELQTALKLILVTKHSHFDTKILQKRCYYVPLMYKRESQYMYVCMYVCM